MRQYLIQTQKVSTELKLTPGVQLFLKIIQMPITELHEFIEQQAQTNPILEIEYQDTPEETNTSTQNTSHQEDIIPDLFQHYTEEYNIPLGSHTTQSDRRINQQISQKSNWKEKLFKQLLPFLTNNITTEQLKMVIENLSEDGLLNIPTQELALQINTTEEKLLNILHLIQEHASPAGIGARNVQECILIQIKRRLGEDHFSYKIVKHHFIDLIRKNDKAISKKMKIPLKQVEFTKQLLRTLYSCPPITESINHPIVPEYEIKIIDGELIIEKTSFQLPRIHLNKHYLDIARTIQDTKTKEFLKNYLIQAKALTEAIYKRQEKLKAMIEFLCQYQRDFIENGPSFLKPLTLKEVATACNLSESTISRLSQQKYIQLPWGCVKVKDFFLHPLSHSNNVSKHEIISRIKQILEENNKISDEKIRQILSQEGITISRRTINKYRNLHLKNK